MLPFHPPTSFEGILQGKSIRCRLRIHGDVRMPELHRSRSENHSSFQKTKQASPLPPHRRAQGTAGSWLLVTKLVSEATGAHSFPSAVPRHDWEAGSVSVRATTNQTLCLPPQAQSCAPAQRRALKLADTGMFWAARQHCIPYPHETRMKCCFLDR